jgi:hypothetical protein
MSAGVRNGRLMATVIAAIVLAGAPLVDAALLPPTPPIEIDNGTPADVAAGATRGTAVQVASTLPPPIAPPGDSYDVPTDSGSGRRIVYSKGFQRIWMIEADGSIYNTHRVSGRPDQPRYGTYAVFSRSPFTCSNAHSNICMRWMVRFAKSFRNDNIGFHEIPRRDGVPMQSDDEIGLALSGGCVRQLTDDAIITWDWAQLGTVVVVVP